MYGRGFEARRGEVCSGGVWCGTDCVRRGLHGVARLGAVR